jgi:hypothetical protein
MELRRFIISIVTKYNGEGFKEADADAEKLSRTSKRAAGATDDLDRSLGESERTAAKAAVAERQLAKETERAAKAAEKAAATRAKAAVRAETDFLKAVSSAEKAADKEDSLAAKQAAAHERASERIIAASDKQIAARIRASERAAAAEEKASQRIAASEGRALDKLRVSRERATEDNRKHSEQVASDRQRSHHKMIDDDARLFLDRKRRRLDDLNDEASTRDRRREILRSTASDIGGIAATVGRVASIGAIGVAALGTAVLSTGVNFESLRSRLKTVEGSAEGASAAFGLIQQFAKTTPFELEEVTTAYIRLKNIGLDASTESLTAFGNIAAAQGKPIIEFVEAVADASTGEFERLKEFGIKASTQGDKVAFTFKGLTTTVGKSSDEISAYLKGLGETEFAGSMANQTETAAGMISNLKDGIAQFFDQVSQAGALDAFKGLITDLNGRFSESGGFAQVLSDALVTAIEAVREFIGSVSPEDVGGALDAFYDAVVGGAEAVGMIIDAIQSFIEISGGMENALINATLLIVGMSTAMMGPAGLVVAAGAVGLALGNMAASAVADITGLNDSISESEREIKALEASIRQTNANIDAMERARFERNQAYDKQKQEREKATKARVQGAVGGLGAGLLAETDVNEANFRLNQLSKGTAEQAEQGASKLFTAEGRQVYDAVAKAERVRADSAEKTARAEAKKRGGDADAAGRAARAAVLEGNRATRQKAFETATATFASTGSADAAAEAAVGQIGKVKGAAKGKKGKKGKGDTFFQFEEDVKKAAEKQAEEFAQRELERLIAGGTDPDQAVALAREAGRTRAKELEERFRQAGRIFDGASKNILDMLGLRGPGSVLEGRPPPQTLLITIAPIIKLIENLTITIHGAGSVEENDAMQDAANQARDAMLAKLEDLPALVAAMFELQGKRLLAAHGGGRTIPGVQ